MTISRRDLLVTGAAGLAAASPFMRAMPAFAQAAAEPKFTPEKGAELRILRWSPFVPSEEAAFIANAKKFTDETGVAVRIDKESWEDIRPKAAVAANVGSGPDIVLVWFDDPFQYPDKLVDVSDIGIRGSRATRRATASSSACRSPRSRTPCSTAIPG